MIKLIFSTFLMMYLSTAFSHIEEGSFIKEKAMFKKTVSLLGIDRDTFDRVLDRVESIYVPIIQERLGKRLSVRRSWDDWWRESPVNAYARQTIFRKRPVIKMHGGLARYKGITADAFALVACHEIGHHIGGYPKIKPKLPISVELPFSAEGQSDYFATLKCFRRYAALDNNQKLMKYVDVPEIVQTNCSNSFVYAEDIAICKRSIMASYALTTSVFGSVSLHTNDTKVVNETYTLHPKAQCRLDTYVAGALCPIDVNIVLSDNNYIDGACYRSSNEFEVGFRPLCWFKP